VSVDGGTATYRLLGRGAGVTGYDQEDCLHLLAHEVDGPLPRVMEALRDPVVTDLLAEEVGNPAWRGVWFPRLNMGGPIVG
jgi:hypothetical protein